MKMLLASMVIAANVMGNGFVVGKEYVCTTEDSQYGIDVALMSDNIMVANSVALFRQDNNKMLFVGTGKNGKVFFSDLDNDQVLIGGESIEGLQVLNCKIK